MEKQPSLTFFRRNIFWFVAAGILLVHIFIFRDVLLSGVDIAQNKSSIVRDELVPFFSFSKGYLPSATSQLTGSDEFRVTYSFWTSWVRYNPILPLMLVLMNSLSAYLLFYAAYRLVRHMAASRFKTIYVSLLGALLMHFVLLYAKIAHFYSLILGFSMFALALSITIEQLFFATKIKVRHLVIVATAVLLNPAIHYHLIFYLGAGLVFVLQWLMALITRSFTWSQLWRNLLYLAIIFVASLVPYLAYIQLTTPPADDVFNQIPVNYWMIYYSSVPLLYLLSLDSFGHVDLFRYGDYKAPQATASMLIIFAMIALLFLFKSWRALPANKRNLVYILFVVTLLSVWMAIGYSSSLVSFHDTLGSISMFLSHINNVAAKTLEQLINVFISVLRFPHRFQFLFYYAGGILLSVSLLWIFDFLRKKGLGFKLASAAIALLIAVPFLASTAYRETFLTGNFGGFLAPYKIPDDLQRIKAVLAAQTNNRLFIMPSLESGRVINTNSQRFSFLDKYWIYYLEQPTVYTGYGADTANKIISHMVYRSVIDGGSAWQNILVDDLGVTHILMPKHTEERSAETIYLPGIEGKIADSLQHSNVFQKTYDGPDYALYTSKEHRQAGGNVMVNVTWAALTDTLARKQLLTQNLFFPIQQKDYQKAPGTHNIITDNPERSFYSMYAGKKGVITTPNSNLLPFTTDLIPSSNFTANMFSLSTLYNSNDDYNYTKQTIPSLLSLQTAQFVGIAAHSKGKIIMSTNSGQTGTSKLAVHAASQQNNIAAIFNGEQITLKRLRSDPPTENYLDFSYYTADVELQEGQNTLTIPSANKMVLIEYMTTLPASDVPKDFTRVDLPGLAITPSTEKNVYKVEF